MCGIAGFLSHQLQERDLSLITRRLEHRGPDAEGLFYEELPGITVGLGHRRLSIIDLSTAANQPMVSQCGRYTMIYNGEVYNYQEISHSKMSGFSWRTHSDTEVILENFARFGPSSFEWFNGMFALAIWDSQDQKLYACRDRIGIKPFYYYSNGGEFVFASELKSLQAILPKQELNYSAITNYLYLGYIPQTQTIYTSCHKLLPGHYTVVGKNGIEEIKPFWQLENHIRKEVISDEAKAKTQLKDLMEDAVQKCMISDVPLGIFLSGGVDSSIVAAIAQKHKQEKIKTFSIAFREGRYDESGFAQQVADHVGSDHHKFTVGEDEGIEIIHDFLNIYDEPYGDMSGIPTYLVSKLARKQVTVALCGDGGDELFMGYGFYTWAKRLSNPLLKPFHPAIHKILYNADKNNYRNRSYLFNYSKSHLNSNIFSQCHGNWSLPEVEQLLNTNFTYQFDESLLPTSRKLSETEQQSFFDIKNYLAEELLPKVDRASMQHGLEVRVPFLDSNVIDFALNLDDGLKMKKGVQKYLLKQALYDYVPAEFFDRPKWGFAVPIQEWLRGKLSYLIDDYLSPSRIEEGGILNNEMVQLYIKKFRGGEFFRYHRIWLLIILQKWLLEKHLTFAPENRSAHVYSK
ncbi:MAG: asparagine synthase (glutamine-hydrolyzing) [Chitinophagaceae bacterium]|nr:asparagine synthase (glutamine-hydrolyzing) [Chitinophagaceae bacterium]